MSNQKPTLPAQPAVEDAQIKRGGDADALGASADTASIARKALWALGIGFGGFLLWASLAPLDEGVPTNGTVTIDTKRKTVQHLSGGIVKEVLVREGETVREGQVLMRLDEAVTRANYESIRQRYLGLNAMLSRLRAEQSGASTLVFDPESTEAAAADPFMAQQLNNQRQLFETRRMGLQSDLQGMQEAIEGVKAQRDATRLMKAQREQQLSLLREELAHVRELVKEGYVPRNRQLELERMSAELQAVMADLTGSVIRAERSIAELNQRMVSRKAEYRKEVDTLLADVAREVQADAEKYIAERNNLQRVDIRAPATGQVVGLAIQTVGAVMQPGQNLMSIVPEEQTLLLESQIPPHLIDKVHAGLDTDIRFNTFSHSPQLVVQGKVLSVSGDLITDPQNPQISYYLARLEVTPEGMKTLGARQMQPGMPAEVVIKTGERSMLTYLLNPLLKRLSSSMKEE